MASIKFLMSKKGGITRDVIVRLTVSNAEKFQVKAKGVHIYADYWSDKKQKHNGKFIPEDKRSDIDKMEIVLATLRTTIESRAKNKENITRDWLKEQVDEIVAPKEEERQPEETKELEPQPKTILKVYDEYMEDAPTRLTRTGKPIGVKARMQYQNTRGWLEEFIKNQGVADLELSALDKTFYDKFVMYLYEKGNKKNTVGKHIKNKNTFGK